jgi:hypothetical protein
MQVEKLEYASGKIQPNFLLLFASSCEIFIGFATYQVFA